MALVTFIIYWALNLLQRFEYGGGRHLYDIHPSMYYGYFWVSLCSQALRRRAVNRWILVNVL